MGLQWTLQMLFFVILFASIEGRSNNRHLDFNKEHEIKIENTEEELPTEFEYQIIEGRSNNRHLDFNKEHEIKIENTEEELPTEFEYQMPVHHFARHILCHDRSGMIAFHHVMSRKLSTIDGGFLESFVFDLCRLNSKYDSILDRWVKELFDTDSDGYITQAEMHYFY